MEGGGVIADFVRGLPIRIYKRTSFFSGLTGGGLILSLLKADKISTSLYEINKRSAQKTRSDSQGGVITSCWCHSAGQGYSPGVI